MAATERVTILVDRAQKAALTKQARAAGQSVGEYIRSRVLDEEALLSALLGELRKSTANAMNAIDGVVARLDAREQAMAEREAAIKHKAKAEVSGSDAEALVRWLEAQLPALEIERAKRSAAA